VPAVVLANTTPRRHPLLVEVLGDLREGPSFRLHLKAVDAGEPVGAYCREPRA
jgi:hypothetical protein